VGRDDGGIFLGWLCNILPAMQQCAGGVHGDLQMTSQEFYDAGYAILVYSVALTELVWRYYDKTFTTPLDVEIKYVSGLRVLEMKA
jgi:hypothetical protein